MLGAICCKQAAGVQNECVQMAEGVKGAVAWDPGQLAVRHPIIGTIPVQTQVVMITHGQQDEPGEVRLVALPEPGAVAGDHCPLHGATVLLLHT